MAFARKKSIDGIESMPANARFVGNGMQINEWTSAVVWSPESIEVENDVSIVKVEVADGTAPAVTSGGLEDKNEEVEGWDKYHLRR